MIEDIKEIMNDYMHNITRDVEIITEVVATMLSEDYYNYNYPLAERVARHHVNELYDEVSDEVEEEDKEAQDTWDSWTADYKDMAYGGIL